MTHGTLGSYEPMIETSASTKGVRQMGRPVNGAGALALTYIAATVLLPAIAFADTGALFREKGCAACHGADGSHPVSPDYPVIAGQNQAYLLRQMKDIRDGVRSNGLSTVMRATVTGVSDEDFGRIAEWLAQK